MHRCLSRVTSDRHTCPAKTRHWSQVMNVCTRSKAGASAESRLTEPCDLLYSSLYIFPLPPRRSTDTVCVCKPPRAGLESLGWGLASEEAAQVGGLGVGSGTHFRGRAGVFVLDGQSGLVWGWNIFNTVGRLLNLRIDLPRTV